MARYDLQSSKKQELGSFLAEKLSTIMLDRMRLLVSSGHVFVDGKRLDDWKYILPKGGKVVVHDQEPEPLPSIDFLHIHDHFLVINKQAGVHVNQTETSPRLSVIETVQRRFPEAKLVHRLDRETSGVLLIGRGAHATRLLSQCFEKREVHKTYVTLVEGELLSAESLSGKIARDPRNPRTYRVHSGGKPSRTEITPIDSKDGVTAIYAKPVTGRTHQIRVHLSHAGLPILGDRVYGGPTAVRLKGDIHKLERVMLHALELTVPSVSLPWELEDSSDKWRFSAKIPFDMKEIGSRGLALKGPFK